MAHLIRAATVLPARRTPITFTTEDGLNLVGELALPQDRDPAATLVCLHPLPTQGGMMDSHVMRKASYRLPALADVAVLRFNTRGTESERGRSDGEFGGGESRIPPSTPGSSPQRNVSSVPNDQPSSQMFGSPASTA